jgi:ABC-type glycerol-3-phosphate transport system substrate-binding protein
MPGFEDVKNRFHSSAMTPFMFQDAVYAIPETQDFLLTFVRSDIVEELGVGVPTTWDEVVDLAPALQRQHLDYYLPSNNKNFQNMFVPQVTTAMSSLLYSMLIQNGGQLYEGDGAKTLLLEEEAVDSFIEFTTYFSDFGFQIEANFANRFRSGEMPIGVFNFSLYNTLAVFAPEIRGKWEFAPMPGTMVDGELHNQTTATTTGVVILEDSTEKDAAWEFVKWWTSAEAQAAFGRGLEAILGSAARYPTANLEAFSMLPWSTQDYLMLTAQREQAVGIPTVPGDYIIGRYMDYAFRATVNDRTNPRDNLYEYVTKIDLELARKREEFGLD